MEVGGQGRDEPLKAVGEQGPRKEGKQVRTHGTRAWRVQRGIAIRLASPEPAQVCPSVRPPSITHRSRCRPLARPRWTSRDRIAVRGTSGAIGKQGESTGRITGSRGYDVVEDGFGGGRARVVGAAAGNSSCGRLAHGVVGWPMLAD